MRLMRITTAAALPNYRTMSRINALVRVAVVAGCLIGASTGFAAVSFGRTIRSPTTITRATPPRQNIPYTAVSYVSLSSSTSGEEAEDGNELSSDDDSIPSEESKKTILQKIRAYFAPPDDGLSFRQRLGKMGLAVALSYGWVSNMSYTVTVSLAWFIFSKQTGKSPLAPGQWKGFLAVYAGFWVFNNIIRPIRLGLSVAVSPQFEKVVQKLQDRLKISKSVAIALTVFLANVVGTTTLMCAGIAVASIAAGVPIFPGKP